MTQKERWATRFGLVLAMAGNAVGLGNFLRFPAQAAKNGGGAFLIPYFVALLVMGLPLIWVEWAMGRYGGQKGHHSAPGIFQAHGRSPIWKYFGVLGLWSCLTIASYYLYIESWTMAYAGYSLIGGFSSAKTPGDVAKFLGGLTGEQDNQIIAISSWGMLIFAVCIVLNVYILSRGLAKGIELVSKIGMPLLIVFAAILAVRGLFIQPGDPGVFKDASGESATPWQGLNFVWQPRLDQLSDPAVWLAAAGQIFFTLSIGMGSIHCYASYLREKDDIALTGATAAWTNEFCEVVLGGTILIPIAVAYLGLQTVIAMTSGGSGFGLGFVVFPTLFNNWGSFAPLAGFMWFGLLFFAAITSSLAMGQPIMAFLQQEFGFTRGSSAIAFGVLLLPLALPVALMHSGCFFDEFDYWAGTVMLVVFALAEAVLFAWVFGMRQGWAEINNGAEVAVSSAFYPIIKYVTPIFLAIILVGYVLQPAGRITQTDPSTGKQAEVEAGWTPYVQALFGGPPAPAWEWSGSGMIGRLMHVDLAERAGGVQKNDKFSAEQKTEALAFIDQLKLWRNIDRLLMVGTFVFFSALVWVAWSKRVREGRA